MPAAATERQAPLESPVRWTRPASKRVHPGVMLLGYSALHSPFLSWQPEVG